MQQLIEELDSANRKLREKDDEMSRLNDDMLKAQKVMDLASVKL